MNLSAKILPSREAPVGRRLHNRKLVKSIWDNRFFYIIVAPAVVLTLIFAYKPMYGILLAFKDYDFRRGIMGSPWVGLQNFREVFAVEQFWVSFRNTVVINLLKLLVGFPAPILLAVMLNAIRSKAIKSITQTILYLPHFLSWIVITGILFAFFESDGPLNAILNAMGMEDVNLLADGDSALWVVVLSDLWKEVGWGAIIYLAALVNISPELYEAADIDGANTLQKFWNITMPSILPTISIMLILRVGSLVGGSFDQIYNLYNELIYDKIDIIDTFLYRYGISQGRFEQGTAIGLFINVINVIMLLLANKIIQWTGGEGMY